MKFNEQTLRKTIDDLTLDILQIEQDLIAMKLHKKDLELELISVRLAPPPHAIKNALKRLKDECNFGIRPLNGRENDK